MKISRLQQHFKKRQMYLKAFDAEKYKTKVRQRHDFGGLFYAHGRPSEICQQADKRPAAKGKIFSLLDCGKGKWDRET